MSPSDHITQCPGLAGFNAYIRPLTTADVKSCVAVESTFPEQERCSEEKVQHPSNRYKSPQNQRLPLSASQFKYRLTACPSLSVGLFIKTQTGIDQQIGHVIGARTSSNTITEASMGMPENWESLPSDEAVVVDGQVVGNDPMGENVAIHSVVTIPQFQGRGVGKALVRAYIEYIKETQRGSDFRSIVLIAHDYLVKFYEQGGFENRGVSECRFAGGVWFDLVCEFDNYALWDEC
jgi:GNAT superfamily N-acetyltransferase